MDKLIDIFCDVDDFCHKFLPVWEAELIADGVKKRRRRSNMSTSECMTIVDFPYFTRQFLTQKNMLSQI